MQEGSLGLLMVWALIFFIVCLIVLSRFSTKVKGILIGAIVLRILTSLYYYDWTFVGQFTKRRGNDSSGYHRVGLELAEEFARLDFSSMGNLPAKWWGTFFMQYPAGLVITLVGPHPLASFLFFSLLGLLGLLCFAVVFHRAYPHMEISRYLAWLLLFPSLALWTSAIGKEAVILLGLGLAALGLLARRGPPNFILAGIGLFLIFAIRPQVAAVVVLALVLAQAFSREHRWTFFSTLRLVVVIAGGVFVINMAMQEMGAEGIDDVAGIQGYIEEESGTATDKGTSVGEQAPGLSGAPLAFFNILFRPFLWEARSLTQMVSALEMTALWIFAYRNRRRLWSSIKGWRSDSPMAFSLLFTLVYATTLGMVILNMGIVARQRIYIFPCLFLLMLAEPLGRRITGVSSSDVLGAGRRPAPARLPMPMSGIVP